MRKLSLKSDNRKRDFMRLLPFVVLLGVFAITIGYSATNDNLVIGNAKARVMKQAIIRVTHASVAGGTNSAQTTYLDFGVDDVVATFSLPNSNSSVTYNVEVVNLGSAEMGISEINGLPSNLKYTLTGYNLGAALCDTDDNTKCTLGSATRFQITIEYDTNGYDGVTTSFNNTIEFVFHEMQYTARIGTHYYETIQEAINDSPTDGTETTIVLLKNVYQRIKIWRGNNIVLDMENLVLHNKSFSSGSGDPVVEIFGARDVNNPDNDNTSNVGSAIFKMTNGTIMSEANQGAVNVERGGTFIMTGGSILASGNRQAVYIRNGGIAQISGTAYLRATAEPAPNASPPNYRATVHNVSGTLTITGGTFEAVGNDGIALMSESTTTIGTNDGTVSTTVPAFIGKSIGIRIKNNTTFNFYDGIAKGKDNAIFNSSDIDDKETGYSIVHSGETIDADTYQTAFLSANSVNITFSLDGGSLDVLSWPVVPGEAIGPLPIPTKANYDFAGWYDSNNNLVGSNTTISSNTTFTAHWTPIITYNAARIGIAEYPTLQDAVDAVLSNTETTITIIDDLELSDIITIPPNKSIVIDLNDHTVDTTAGTVFANEGILKIDDSGTTGVLTGGKVTNAQITVINNKSGGTLYVQGGTISSNRSQVIDNNGTMYITGGKITIDFDQGVINNNAGATLDMSGGEIVVTVAGSRRQAIYNKGTVAISGTAKLSSASSDRATLQNDASGARITISGGTIESTNTSCQRGAVQNTSGGILTVTGGTIISKSTNTSNAAGIQNNGTLTIGVQGGGIDITTPVIRGVNKGVYRAGGTVNIYDGILQSKTAPLSPTNGYNNIEANSQPNTTGTILIDNVTYKTWYLESTP